MLSDRYPRLSMTRRVARREAVKRNEFAAARGRASQAFASPEPSTSADEFPWKQGTAIDRLKIVRGNIPKIYDEEWSDFERKAIFTPFQRRDWLRHWQHHVGERISGDAVTAFGYRAGRLVLVLPLITERWGFVRALMWRGYRIGDYGAPIVDETTLEHLDASEVSGLLRLVAKRVGNIDLVYLSKQPERIGLRSNPLVLPASDIYHVGAHAVRLGSDWDRYYRAQRSGKSRSRLKQKFAVLGKLGEIDFRLGLTPKDKADIVRRCLDLKSDQLGENSYWNPFADARVRELFSACAEGDSEDVMWAAALDVGGSLAAAAFGFKNRDEWLLYQMAMTDGPSAKFSPGTLLLHNIMRQCMREGVERLDLSLGDEAYKMDWCNEHSPLYVSYLPINALGWACKVLLLWRGALRRLLVSHPVSYAAARRLKALLARYSLFSGRRA